MSSRHSIDEFNSYLKSDKIPDQLLEFRFIEKTNFIENVLQMRTFLIVDCWNSDSQQPGNVHTSKQLSMYNGNTYEMTLY